MDNEADAAKRAFPNLANKIDRLVLQDEGFADLCRDFQLAVSEHRNWKASNAPERDDRLSEYGVLIDELRREIERALSSAEVFRLRDDNSRRH